MSRESFDHVQLTSIKLAAERAAEGLGATKEKDKLVVARAVFDMAAETGIFDTEKLIELAQQRLTPAHGWRFDAGEGRS